MVTRVTTSISLEKSLLDHVEQVAERLNLSQAEFFEKAIEAYVRRFQEQERRIVNQGDIYWLRGYESGVSHPHVVVQDNIFNHSRLNTVIVCSLTSNLHRVNMPGNVLLDAGEANLPKQSVVEVSKVAAVYKTQLAEYIGTLTEARIEQILAGMSFLKTSFLDR
jgi:mRNA interferase MazF